MSSDNNETTILYSGFSIGNIETGEADTEKNNWKYVAVLVSFISFGLIYSVTSAVEIRFSVITVLIAVIISAVLFSVQMCNKVLPPKVFITVLVFYLLAAYIDKHKIYVGFDDIVLYFDKFYSAYYSSKACNVAEWELSQFSSEITYALVYLSIALSFIFSLLLSKKMSTFPLVFCSVCASVISVFVGRHPGAVAVLCLLSAVFVILFVGEKYRFITDIKDCHYVFAFSLGISMIALVVVTFFKDFDKTAYSDYANPVRTAMDNSVNDVFDYKDDIGENFTGRIGDVAGIEPTYDTMLYVTYVPSDESTIYIKKYNGNYYYDNFFDSQTYVTDTVNDTNEVYYGFDMLMQLETQRNTVDNGYSLMICQPVYDYDYIDGFFPYSSLPSGLHGDKYNSVNAMYREIYELEPSEYTICCEYTPLPEYDVYASGDEFREEIPKYDDYLNDTCLQVPEYLEFALENFIDNVSFSELDSLNVEDFDCVNEYRIACVDEIKKEFNHNFNYTYTPGLPWDDMDAIEYFLTKSRSGYCSYFAASAVMLLRSKGVPCRYAEGYILPYSLTEQKGEYTTFDADEYYFGFSELKYPRVMRVPVDDSYEHAWIEVYIEGYGFYPFEVTPIGISAGNVVAERPQESNREEFSYLYAGITFAVGMTLAGLYYVVMFIAKRILEQKQISNGQYRNVVYKHNESIIKLLLKGKLINNINALPQDIYDAVTGYLRNDLFNEGRMQSEDIQRLCADAEDYMKMTEYILYSENKIKKNDYEIHNKAYLKLIKLLKDVG